MNQPSRSGASTVTPCFVCSAAISAQDLSVRQRGVWFHGTCFEQNFPNHVTPVLSSRPPLAVELGRRGGLKGGKARAVRLSPAERAAIARRAARARWAGPKER